MSGDQKTLIKGNPSQYVKLNIGGCLHYTTIGTLCKQDTMLRAMFSGRLEVLTDSEGTLHRCVTEGQAGLMLSLASSHRLDSDRSLRHTLWHDTELPAGR